MRETERGRDGDGPRRKRRRKRQPSHSGARASVCGVKWTRWRRRAVEAAR